MIALPVFPSRRLFQTELSYHVDSGITKPEDLAGKKLGVAEYQQTAALWIRGILEHDFGVSQYKIHWYMERSEEMSHGGATGFKPPAGISFNRIAPNKSLVSTLLDNELDVAHVASPFVLQANTLDRSSRIVGKGDWSKIRPLFPDRMAEAARFHKKHGFLPVNHAYIIRGDIYKKYPWVAFNLYTGFVKAKAAGPRETAGADSHRAFLRTGVRGDDARNDRRRSVSLRHQGQPGDARHDHRLFPRAGTYAAKDDGRGTVRRETLGL